MNAVAVIPARYASTRLPGKPLVEIAGKAMIQHVFERVNMAKRISRTIIATDDDRIREYMEPFGEVVMTSPDHISGTDRVAAVARALADVDVVVNVQGDEPLIDPKVIDMLVQALEATDVECATPVARIDSTRELFDTNVVKVVLRKDFTPLYFSRSPIPCVRGREPEEWLSCATFYRHIGIYAYRRASLEKFVSAAPPLIESCEQLEQLRMLDFDMPLLCVETDYNGPAVDTPEDVMKVEALISASR